MLVVEHMPGASLAEEPRRSILQSLARGFRQICPACGTGRLYGRYLKVVDRCDACDEELHHHRADDAPPYFTILVVGHIVVWGVLVLETAYAPETWVHMVIWLPMLIALSLWFLPRVKGALVGLQWALRMHGFGGETALETDAGSSPAELDR